MLTVLESIATANPPLSKSQAFAATFMQRVEGMSEPVRTRIPQIYERSGIETRYSCIDDYGCDAEDFAFFPPNWALSPAPTTAARNRKYRQAAVPLAERTAREALMKAGVRPSEVTHVVTVSCTGFFAPGLDVELVKRLDLSPSTQRTLIGFMGCFAAFNAFRVAHAFCQSNPVARVLVVCVELCTLHFQIEDSLESAVVNAIFSDGAAAAVLSARPPGEVSGKLVYVDGYCLLDEDSMGDMTWEIGDTGFNMGLTPRVPRVLAHHLPGYIETLLSRNGLHRDDVGFWAVHPGGRAIVEKTRDVLGLSDLAVFDSLDVLRQYGNMSSPTILFILKRFLEGKAAVKLNGSHDQTHGVALAFGPGLTIEGALFKWKS